MKARDIKPLLERRMQDFADVKIQELYNEALRCEDQHPKTNHSCSPDEQLEFVRFQRLMTLGKVREATHYVTRRFRHTDILDPNEVAQPAQKIPKIQRFSKY